MDSSDSLHGCVLALSSSLSSLRSASENLDNGTHDFPRLATVLRTNRVFDVVAEQKMQEVKDSLEHEVEPQIKELLPPIEAELARLAVQVNNLKAKALLKGVRIHNQETPLNSVDASDSRRSRPATEEQLAELREFQVRSERLAYSLSKTKLKQRKMRMSMAMGGH